MSPGWALAVVALVAFGALVVSLRLARRSPGTLGGFAAGGRLAALLEPSKEVGDDR